METWLSNFVNLIPIGPLYYCIIGILCFIDSVAFIGILYPGGLLVLFAGFLAANGKGDLFMLAFVSATGSIAGDLLSYVIGARSGAAIMQRPWFKRREKLLQKGQIFFAAHGGKSVFIGRFVGFLRPFIPFIAGSARMRPLPFTLYALVSGLIWGISTPGLGYIGGASWQMVQVWSGRFSLLFLLLVFVFVVNLLFWRHVLPHCGRMAELFSLKISSCWLKFLNGPVIASFNRRHPRFSCFLNQRFTTEHSTGIFLTVGVAISSIFALLFAWFGRSIHHSSALIHLDQRIYELLSVMHHPWTDLFFAVITWVGSFQAMFIFALLALFILIINNRDFSALILVFGITVGELLALLAKEVVSRPRPTPFFTDLRIDGASFPSLHAFSALLFYGLIVYFLIDTVRNRRRLRLFLILFVGCIVLLIGFSRIFLGLHWATDVLAGYILAAFWLTFLITLCETRFRYGGYGLQRGFRPFNLSLRYRISLITLAVLIAGTMIFVTIDPFLRSLSLDRARRTYQISTVEDIVNNHPRTTETLWGRANLPLSLIVLADQEVLTQLLASAGWLPAHQVGLRGFKLLLVDLLQGDEQQVATIVPQLVEGQAQSFSFVRSPQTPESTGLRSLLIWDLGRRLPDGRIAWALLVHQQIGVKHLSILPLPLPLIAAVGNKEVEELSSHFEQAPKMGELIIISPDRGLSHQQTKDN